jgi:hypothetical protein
MTRSAWCGSIYALMVDFLLPLSSSISASSACRRIIACAG